MKFLRVTRVGAELLPLLHPKVQSWESRREMEGGAGGEDEEKQEFVYRVSIREEWEELQKTGVTLGGDLDRSTGCIHLSDLRQVKTVLRRFFQPKEGIFLLQVSTAKLGEGLIYEEADGTYFPHFYGPSRSFVPLPLDAVTKAEKLKVKNGELSCSLLDEH